MTLFLSYSLLLYITTVSVVPVWPMYRLVRIYCMKSGTVLLFCHGVFRVYQSFFGWSDAPSSMKTSSGFWNVFHVGDDQVRIRQSGVLAKRIEEVCSVLSSWGNHSSSAIPKNLPCCVQPSTRHALQSASVPQHLPKQSAAINPRPFNQQPSLNSLPDDKVVVPKKTRKRVNVVQHAEKTAILHW